MPPALLQTLRPAEGYVRAQTQTALTQRALEALTVWLPEKLMAPCLLAQA
jgi:hypothetical protein